MRRPISLLATLVALPVTAAAQGAAPGEPILLDEIVLTAGITPVAQDGYARAHTVLTATEIEDRGIATVQDALRALPGVSVSGSGAKPHSCRYASLITANVGSPGDGVSPS